MLKATATINNNKNCVLFTVPDVPDAQDYAGKIRQP